jgi:hypothetical protein
MVRGTGDSFKVEAPCFSVRWFPPISPVADRFVAREMGALLWLGGVEGTSGCFALMFASRRGRRAFPEESGVPMV